MKGFGEAMSGGAPTPQAPPQANGFQPTQEGTPATPEQQQQYNRFVAMSILMLYDEKFMPKAQQMLSGGTTPVDAMARIGSSIASRIYMGAKKQGAEIPAEVVLHGGWELMNEIRTFAQTTGAGEISDEQMEDAYYLASDMMRSTLQGAGMVDQEQAQGEFEQMRGTFGDDAFDTLVQRLQGVQQQQMSAMTPQQGGAA
jgi:hypothetical protein